MISYVWPLPEHWLASGKYKLSIDHDFDEGVKSYRIVISDFIFPDTVQQDINANIVSITLIQEKQALIIDGKQHWSDRWHASFVFDNELDAMKFKLEHM